MAADMSFQGDWTFPRPLVTIGAAWSGGPPVRGNSSEGEGTMAFDASQIIGSPQLAGVTVLPRGASKRQANATGGSLPARIALGKTGETASDAPDFGRMAYLAVTDSELALVNVKSGRLTMKLNELIVRVPRTDVASAELGSGVICPLTITFADGQIWRLEVSRLNKKHAQAVVHTVGS
jgi:hypothetical protein